MKLLLILLTAAPLSAQIDPANLRETIAYLSSDRLEGRAPMSRGSRFAQEYITARLNSYGIETHLQSVKKNFWGEEIGKNIIGVLKGSKSPGECVYIEAHYDHWGKAEGKIQPGANDNASGVAQMLELARLLSQRKPERSVIFLASDFEEGAAIPDMGGLKGASYHVKNPYCSKGNIKAAIVMDMMGGRFIDGAAPNLFLMGGESDETLYALIQQAPKAFPFIKTMGIYAIEPVGKMVARGDYGPFRDEKIPFLFATSGIPPEYHTPEDTLEKIDFDFMRKAGGALEKIISHLASSTYQPKGKRAHLDWAGEAKTLGSIADELTNLDFTIAQAPYAAGVLKLADDLEGKNPRKESVQEAVQKAVMTLMEMNGSLRLWEHLVRDH